MKILDISNYPNLLDHLSLNSDSLCKIIEKFTLEFPQTRNQKVEWGIKFPLFLTPFYKFVYQNNSVLTQKDFFNFYLSENPLFFEENKFNSELIDGLKARIYRTYPSLVRDLHFSLYLKENLKDFKVVYNRQLDVEEGIDVLLIKNDQYYGINLYTDTHRAYIGREKKVFRHTKFDNVFYVELPVEFNGSFKCGAFFLYGKKELNQILVEIQNNYEKSR